MINYIPHRIHEGYGLQKEIGKLAKRKGVSLLIAVDCGINAFQEVETLNHLGIDIETIDLCSPGGQHGTKFSSTASDIQNPLSFCQLGDHRFFYGQYPLLVGFVYNPVIGAWTSLQNFHKNIAEQFKRLVYCRMIAASWPKSNLRPFALATLKIGYTSLIYWSR